MKLLYFTDRAELRAQDGYVWGNHWSDYFYSKGYGECDYVYNWMDRLKFSGDASPFACELWIDGFYLNTFSIIDRLPPLPELNAGNLLSYCENIQTALLCLSAFA